MKKGKFVIAIDGPSGAGKSTVAKALAEKIKAYHLNSGIIFRAIASVLLTEGIDLGNEIAVVSKTRQLKIEMNPKTKKGLLLRIDGEPPLDSLDDENVSRAASIIAVYPGVREVALLVQRAAADAVSAIGGTLIVEGRDAGSVVFSDASLKIFLDADLSVRAKRRHLELVQRAEKSGGTVPQLFQVEQAMKERDMRDANRKVAPRVCPSDALCIDVSKLSIDGVLAKLLHEIHPCFA